MSERERQEALKRAAKRWVPRTRFIANTVPIPVMHWLVSHEEAIRVGGAIPPIPFDVAEWMADHVDNFAGGPQPQAVVSEEVEEVSEDTPGDYPLQKAVCEVCGTRFEARRADARFCSNRCRVTAHRARAA